MVYSYLNAILIFILIVIGLLFVFKTSGYKYIGLLLFFCAFLDLFYFLCSFFPFESILIIRNTVTIFLVICFLYFCLIEFFIIKDSFVNSDETLDYIIVHGAKVYGSLPSPSLQDRLEATLEYLQAHHTTIAILTGAKWPFADLSEAQCMFDWLTERGIPEHRLLIEDQATNTLDNLRYAMKEINAIESTEAPKIGLLTSDYHMHRTLYLARSESIDPIGISVPTARFFVRLNYFIREAFAMTEIYLFGVEGL